MHPPASTTRAGVEPVADRDDPTVGDEDVAAALTGLVDESTTAQHGVGGGGHGASSGTWAR